MYLAEPKITEISQVNDFRRPSIVYPSALSVADGHHYDYRTRNMM